MLVFFVDRKGTVLENTNTTKKVPKFFILFLFLINWNGYFGVIN